MFHKKLHMFSALLLVIGGLNWGATGFGYNFVKILHDLVNQRVKIPLDRIVYALVGLSALYLLTKRDLYLPFLGETVLPCAMFNPRVPETHNPLYHLINTGEPNKKIIYWAAYSTEGSVGPTEAYGDFDSSGVVMTDPAGVAKVVLKDEPGKYQVRNKKTLNPHIHYRVCHDSGMLSEVRTEFV